MDLSGKCSGGRQGENDYFCSLLGAERRGREEEICSVCDAFYQAAEKNEVLQKAFLMAARAHKGQMRKGSDIPYLIHPVRTWAYVKRMTDSVEEQAAALLHDVVEDTPVTPGQLREVFGDFVAELVETESERKRADRPAAQTWKIRKTETLERVRYLAGQKGTLPYLHIAFGDKLANLYSMSYEYAQTGDKLWRKFNQKDKRMHAWYYGELGKIFRDYFRDGEAAALVQEYMRYYREIFGDENRGPKIADVTKER